MYAQKRYSHHELAIQACGHKKADQLHTSTGLSVRLEADIHF